MTPAVPLNPFSFQALVVEESAAVGAFVALLQREQQILVDGHADLLPDLAEEKSAQCQLLDQYSRRRVALLAGGGISPEPARVSDWVQLQAPPLKAAWEDLIRKAEEARNLNRLNGELIASKMQGNQQSLTVLLEVANRASVYGPNGQPRTSGRGRMLGSC